RFPAARDTFQAIDQALGFALSRLMFEGPEEDLTATHNAQPAILAHSAAVFAVIAPRADGVAAAAGHSLGEYSAYVTAGALSAIDAATLVRRRGELMHQAGSERPGSFLPHGPGGESAARRARASALPRPGLSSDRQRHGRARA